MLTSLEVSGREIPVFSVRREGFPAPNRRESRLSSNMDIEFLASFLRALVDHSLVSSDLVFSGINGEGIKKKPQAPVLPQGPNWVMDEKTWRKGLTYTTPSSPADYAERYAIPCIGIYDMGQVRIVNEIDGEKLRSHQISDFAREGFDITRPLRALRNENPDAEIYDPVVHIDHPDGSLADALQGVAFLEY